MSARLGWLAVLSACFVFAWSAAACVDDAGGDEGEGTTCGPGQILVGDACRDQVGNTGGTGGTSTNGATSTNNATTSTNGGTTSTNNSTTSTNNGTTSTNNATTGDGSCIVGQSRCADANTLERCIDAAGRWNTEPCPDGQLCDGGACRAPFCEPGELLAGECFDLTSRAICNATGTGREPEPCGGGLSCRDGACTDRICDVGETRCQGTDTVLVCNDDGTDFVPSETCSDATLCDEGICRSLCEINSKVSSYLGCDYWTVDLDNIAGAENLPHAVVISNPDAELSAEITITRTDGTAVALGANGTIAPGGLAIYELPVNAALDGTGLFTNNAWRVTSSIPVTAHQFNPLNGRTAGGEPIFTNDASLLLPTNANGQRYIVMSWKHRAVGGTLRGFATIIATEEGPTEVTVTPSTNVVAGGGVPALGTGTPWTTTLNQGEVLSLQTNGSEGADLTGTVIESSQSVAVFGGHECANIPTSSVDACDHIEQQLFPVASWGTRVMAVPFSARSPSQQDTWVIVAGDEGARLITNPLTSINGLSLGPNQKIEFTSNQAFEVNADNPILVGQFLHGSNYDGFTRNDDCSGFGSSNGIGDPAFTLGVPVEQYRPDYIVLTPEDYTQDFVNIVAPNGAAITLDNAPLSGFTPIGTTGYSWLQQPVNDGIHRLVGDQPFGLVAYGYDCFVSYAYPGGLNLEALD